MFSNVFHSNSNETSIHFQELQSLINQNSNSLLQNFPPLPLDKVTYGCYETNAQFQYSILPDFDKNLILVNFLIV